jgi:hypothetical protein
MNKKTELTVDDPKNKWDDVGPKNKENYNKIIDSCAEQIRHLEDDRIIDIMNTMADILRGRKL